MKRILFSLMMLVLVGAPLPAFAQAATPSINPTQVPLDKIQKSQELFDKGNQLRNSGRFEKAAKKLKESLALREEIFGTSHIQVAYVWSSLG